MKGLFRHFIVIALFSLIISGISACTYSTDAEAPTNQNDNNRDDGYPPTPSKIAKAEFKLIDGETFGPKETKGRVTLINLWGVWCIPCIKEMPHLIEMQEKYKDKEFQIVGLNVGDADGGAETEENIKVFQKKQNLNYKLGWVDRSILGVFYETAQINAVPISFLINRRGKLVGVFIGGGPRSIDPMKKAIEKWVNES